MKRLSHPKAQGRTMSGDGGDQLTFVSAALSAPPSLFLFKSSALVLLLGEEHWKGPVLRPSHHVHFDLSPHLCCET